VRLANLGHLARQDRVSVSLSIPRPTGTPLGVAAMLGSILSVQIGASFAKRLIEQVPGPLGATWLRLGSAGLVMAVVWLVRWGVTRRRARAMVVEPVETALDTRTPVEPVETALSEPQPDSTDSAARTVAATASRPGYALPLTLMFCVTMLTMNASIYESFARLPVGIAITIEFLGPLGVAIAMSLRRAMTLTGAARHRRLAFDLALVVCAGGGVALLGVRPVSLNLLGVLLALLAAACWACYILLGGVVTRWYGTQNLLTVMWLAAGCLFALPALAPAGAAFLTWPVLRWGLVVGLVCSVIPTVLELFVLGRLPPGLFAILESLAPAVAALAAWPILGEWLHPTDWIAIALVILASIGATLSAARRRLA